MENNKSKTGLHVFVGILLGIIICGGVVFATYSLGYLTFNTENEKVNSANDNDTSNEITEEKTNVNSLDFDTSKIANGTADFYYVLQNYNGSINIELDETRTIAKLGFNRQNLANIYTLDLNTTNSPEIVVENKNITFSQGVKDIFIGGIGQDSTGDTVLFLMDDGTVEYIPIYLALSTNGIDGLVSYGPLADLKDVVKFFSVGKRTYGLGSRITILAQTTDGTLYDLEPIIENATNKN